MEVWKKVKGFDAYEVSDAGRVRRTATGKVLRGMDNGAGYRKVELVSESDRKRKYIHRIVAEAFCENPKGKKEVNHMDGNPRNNRADNLEWVDSGENTRHAVYSHNLKAWGNAAKSVQSIDMVTGETHDFATISEAERFFNTRHISAVLKGKRNHTKGQHFRYLEGGEPIAHFDYRNSEP